MSKPTLDEINSRIEDEYASIESLKSQFIEKNFLNNDSSEELETIVAHAIQFGELCNQRDSFNASATSNKAVSHAS